MCVLHAPKTPEATRFLAQAGAVRSEVLGALGLVAEPLFGVGVAKFPTALHRDCSGSMRAGAVNVLVAKGDPAEHILVEYGLSWIGGDSRLALEATRDALHGNAHRVGGWSRTCYGAF